MKTRMIENRMWVATLLAPYNEKKVSAEELIPFSWEVKAKQEIMNTPERKAESKRRIDHWDKIIAQQQ